MEKQSKDHLITVRMIIDGEEFAKGINLYANETSTPAGIGQQKKLVNSLSRAVELTIKHELGRQGEPAFIEYAPKDNKEVEHNGKQVSPG
jgi:hypothetical protein